MWKVERYIKFWGGVGWGRAVGVVQARRQDFLRGGDIQRVDRPNDVRGASLWGRGGGGGVGGVWGELVYLRLHFEHFEILDISQSFNLQM